MKQSKKKYYDPFSHGGLMVMTHNWNPGDPCSTTFYNIKNKQYIMNFFFSNIYFVQFVFEILLTSFCICTLHTFTMKENIRKHEVILYTENSNLVVYPFRK